MAEIIVTIVCLILAGLCMLISICSFFEKGYLFNNAYIWASGEEREQMDKKPHYRQSAIVFCLISFIFVVIAMSVIMQNNKIKLLEIPLTAGTMVYAIVSSIQVGKMEKKKRQEDGSEKPSL